MEPPTLELAHDSSVQPGTGTVPGVIQGESRCDWLIALGSPGLGCCATSATSAFLCLSFFIFN
jgi:hypothetical protein